MSCRLFNSKFLTILTLCFFIFLLTSEASSYSNYQGKETFSKLIQEGETFYQSKEYEKAIIRYMEAYMEAEGEAEFSDVYMRLALVYSVTNQNEKAKDYLLKLLKIQPDRTIDEQSYPAAFVILFYQAKIEALKPAVEKEEPKVQEVQAPAKAETKREEPEKAVVQKQEPVPVKEVKKMTPETPAKESKPKTVPEKEVKKSVAKESPPVDVKKEPESKATQQESLPEKLKKVPGVKESEVTEKEASKKEEPKVTAVKKTEEKPVVKTQIGEETKLEKGKKFPWLLIGGLVVIGGALAYLLLGGKSSEEETAATTGSIQVNSNPSGAKVFLDGTNTDQVTNTTLTGIPAGSHELKISKEGYVDSQENVIVTGGETVTVNADLSKHTIKVNSPVAGTVLVKGQTLQINWTTGGGGAVVDSADRSHFNQLLAAGSGSRTYLRLKVFRERESIRSNDRNLQAKRVDHGDGLSHVRKVIGELSPSAKGENVRLSRELEVSGTNPGGNPAGLNLSPQTQAGTKAAEPDDTAKIHAISEVTIELYESGKKVLTIVNRTPNDGRFNWKVPQKVEDGFQYKIRVSAADEPSVYGTSPTFSVKTDYMFATKWGSRGAGEGEFNQPVGIAFKQSKVFVVENINSRISMFTPQGTFLSKYGSPGNGPDQFNGPIGVAVDNSGNVYLSDTGNERIMKFTPNGVFVREWGKRGGDNGDFRSPSGIAVDGQGNVYVADSYNFRVQKFNSDGKFLLKWGTRGIGDDQFGLPTGLAADSNGNVYVADTENHRIMKFDSSGKFLLKWGSKGTGDDQFDQPSGVGVDDAGNVFVSDSENHRIMKFDSDGKLIIKWGSRGDGDQQFRYPAGIALDLQGNVYVADSGNYRIMKFSPAK